MAVYHGRNGQILLASTGTGVPSAVLHLNGWSLDLSRDTVDTTSFGDVNKTYVVGLKDVTGSFDGFWDDAEQKLFAGADSANGVFMYLYPATSAPTKYAYGPAWLDMSVETGVADAVTISGNFSANGAWGITL